jgi:hypothetical protein
MRLRPASNAFQYGIPGSIATTQDLVAVAGRLTAIHRQVADRTTAVSELSSGDREAGQTP